MLFRPTATNLRNVERYEACLEFGASGTFVAYVATGIKVARTGSGAYTLTLPKRYAGLLGAQLTNGGAAAAVGDDNLSSNGVVNVTITEPAAPKKVFVSLCVPTDKFNARIPVP